MLSLLWAEVPSEADEAFTEGQTGICCDHPVVEGFDFGIFHHLPQIWARHFLTPHAVCVYERNIIRSELM
eukprot:10731723-Lingulodinium_polyedra.AAC.1